MELVAVAAAVAAVAAVGIDNTAAIEFVVESIVAELSQKSAARNGNHYVAPP